MKSLTLSMISLFLISNVLATGYQCEMVDIKNPKNKITATVSELDSNGYGFNQHEGDGLDDLYWLSLEVTDANTDAGTLDIMIFDENDEIGSFYCDLRKDSVNDLICSEPIYDENNDYKYDVNCRKI